MRSSLRIARSTRTSYTIESMQEVSAELIKMDAGAIVLSRAPFTDARDGARPYGYTPDQ